jgi:hypothetical protein
MALAAVRPLFGFRNRREQKFFRLVTDHVRHNLTRPIDNAPLSMPELQARAAGGTTAARPG